MRGKIFWNEIGDPQTQKLERIFYEKELKKKKN